MIAHNTSINITCHISIKVSKNPPRAGAIIPAAAHTICPIQATLLISSAGAISGTEACIAGIWTDSAIDLNANTIYTYAILIPHFKK